MSKLKIFTFPDHVLKEKAKPIERVEKDLYPLADDMLETMYDAPGVGLAANQVGILKRIIVVDTDYEIEGSEAEGEEGHETGTMPEASEVRGGIILHKKPTILINPEIIYREGKILYCEGCLSVPEYQAEVERSEKIKIKYRDIDGVERTMDAEGLRAVCIQHEIDHLEGKLFIERLSPIKRDLAKKKLLKRPIESEGEEES